MGAWGPAIFSDDLAVDVREDFRDLIAEGLAPAEATARLREEYRDSVRDEEEGPVFLLALAATQWKTGHVDPPTIQAALEAIDQGRGLERWDGSELRARRRALDRLAEQLRTPPREPVRIRRRARNETTLAPGDVIAVPRGEGRFFAAVVEIHEDKGGRSPVVKVLPYLDDLPPLKELRRAAKPTRADHYEIGSLFMLFDERSPEVVARGVLSREYKHSGGLGTFWDRFPGDAEKALRAYGLVA